MNGLCVVLNCIKIQMRPKMNRKRHTIYGTADVAVLIIIIIASYIVSFAFEMGWVDVCWYRMKFRRPNKMKWWNESSSSLFCAYTFFFFFLLQPMCCHGAGMLHKYFDLIWGITTKLHIIIFYYLVGSGYGNGIGRIGRVYKFMKNKGSCVRLCARFPVAVYRMENACLHCRLNMLWIVCKKK